ncbi:Na+/H+ antiporter subunit E [Niveispirillum fermenti]|uniref:Na+/H+ antiporter subunit E n=1 Tax=Niveispirillum fermenti TaxID=1233113 RepID=UPI003A88C84C
MSLLVVNILLALAWMGIMADFSLESFISGIVLSHFILWIARPLYPDQSYFQRLWGGLGFTLWLAKEIVWSALKVAAGIVGIGEKVQPAVVAIPLDVETDWEIELFACAVTLTPGTLSLDVAPDRRTLYIHAMFGSDPDAVRREIKSNMERRILEVLR